MNSLTSIFENIWSDYTAFNPHAKTIYDQILAHERQKYPEVRALVNDHIALRTFNHPRLNIQVLGRLFEKHGYEAKGEYHFEDKKLYARHWEHADPQVPKVFISELLTQHFSPRVREIADAAAASFTDAQLATAEMLWAGRPWKASHAVYQELLKESEYAAWLYAFGFRCNHFTVYFNALKSFADLNELNQFLMSKGHKLNASGGLIKGTPQECLEQSSTLAGKVHIEFTDGRFEIPACYYEFARRYPQANGQLYTGFIATSADKIFESTNVQQSSR